MNKNSHHKGSLLKKGISFLLLLIMTVPVLAVNNATLFQQVKQKKVTINKTDAPVKEILEEIKRQTNFDFVINAKFITDLGKRTLKVNDVTVDEALLSLLQGTKYKYQIVNNHITFVLENSPQKNTGKEIITIKGTVTDANQNTLPGVTILLEGTTIGISTNLEGSYVLEIPQQEKIVLVYSFMGMKTKRVEYKGQNTINVTLEEDVVTFDEVVVTGYGNVDKGNYTGAATNVDMNNVVMPGVPSIDQMLQGVVPGMLVTNTSGLVGASPKIRVRGTATLLGTQEPVWVVDGVIQRDPQPFNSSDNTNFSADIDDIKQLAGNAISWLNPNDIESITVLKDASATAIYGSKAANGVIVVTTKKAKIGKISVNYSGDFSIGQRPRYGLYDLMNSQEFMQFSKEIYEERRQYPSGSSILPIGFQGLLEKYLSKEITLDEMNQQYQYLASQNTDWFKILFRNSFNHSHSVGISGGSDKIQNRTSISFTQQKGEAKGNDMTSFQANSNTTINWGEKLIVNLLLKGSMREVDGFAYGVDPFKYAYNTSRAIPAYNEDGSLYYHEKSGQNSKAIFNKYIYNYNILNELDHTGSNSNSRIWGATIDLKFRIFYGLEYQGLVSYNSSSVDTKQYASERSFYITQYRGYEYGSVQPNGIETKSSPLPMGGILATSLTNTSTITVRNSLVFDRLFKDKHRVTLQLGIETNSVKTKGHSSSRNGYMPDRGESFATPPSSYLDHGDPDYEIDNNNYVRGSFSVVNRVENELSEYASAIYTYDGRYVFNFSGRVDASNRFGQDKNKRFEPTWSAGLKWRVARERIFEGSWWLNNLDIYSSYGYQGNVVSSVSPELIATNSYSTLIRAYVLKIKTLPYPDLGWEKTKTFNLGVDASFLKDRINFTFNYFKKISKVLSSKSVPYENGVKNGIVTGSTLENFGYDFVINVVPIRMKDFSWQLSLNTAVTRNKIKKNERVNTLSDYTSGSCIVPGEPYSTFYSYEFDQLNPANGQPMFKNMDIEYGKTPADYLVKSGKYIPDFSGGLNMQFKYKRLALYALFAIQWGGNRRLPKLYPNATSLDPGLPRPEQNVSRKLGKRWKKQGDEAYTNIPSLPGIGGESQKLPATETATSTITTTYSMYNYSNIRIANTDFVRCRSLSLSYEFNEKWLKQIHVNRLLLKASMTNPFMWVRDKKWDGLDPETGDWPTRRTTSLSLQVMF